MESPDPIVDVLKRLPSFEGLNEEDCQEIVRNIKTEVFPLNSYFFSQGDLGTKMYIVKRGEVKVERKGDDGKDEIARIKPGEFFGEMALFSNKPRNATCVATEETEVFTLERDDLFALIRSNPGISSRLKKEYLVRVMENRHRDESIGKNNLF